MVTHWEGVELVWGTFLRRIELGLIWREVCNEFKVGTETGGGKDADAAASKG